MGRRWYGEWEVVPVDVRNHWFSGRLLVDILSIKACLSLDHGSSATIVNAVR